MKWRVTSCTVTGSAKSENEDRTLVLEDKKRGLTLALLLDGHNGCDLVDYCMRRVPEIFWDEKENSPGNLISILARETMPFTSGATISAVLLHANGIIEVASLGDSPLVWGKCFQANPYLPLSYLPSHNIDVNPKEAERVQKLGAKIDGAYYRFGENSGHQYTRGLGDQWAKDFLSREPEVGQDSLEPGGFVLLASDGFFTQGKPPEPLWTGWLPKVKTKESASDILFHFADQIRRKGDDASLILCYLEE